MWYMWEKRNTCGGLGRETGEKPIFGGSRLDRSMILKRALKK